MKTLACLAAVILAGVPAAATPILIDHIATTELLPVGQLLTDASWSAVDPDVTGSHTSILAPAGRFVLALHETPIGELDAGITEAMGPGGWDAYRSNVTSELLRVEDDDFAVSRYAIEPAEDSGNLPTELVTPPGVSAEGLASAVAREVTASKRESRDASPESARRDVERAAMSRVQPAALTLVGVCLALAFAGGREWRRRNWHRRHMRRQG